MRRLTLLLILLLLLGSRTPAQLPPVQPVRVDALGDALPEGVIARLGTARLRHLDAVTAQTFSRDGKVLASAGGDKTVRLWEMPTGKALRTIATRSDWPVFGGFRDGDKMLVFWDKDRWACVEAATGKLLRSAQVFDAAVAPDGEVVARRHDGVVQLVRLDTNEVLVRFPGNAAEGDALQFSPDGKLLAHGGNDFVRLLDVATGKEAVRLVDATLGNDRQGPPIQFSPDRRLVLVKHGKGLGLWDPATGRAIRRFDDQKHGIVAAVFDATGKLLLTACTDGSVETIIRRWDVASGKETARLTLPHHADCAFAPDGTTVAAAHYHAITLWDIKTGQSLSPGDAHGSPVGAIAWSPDGRTIASGGLYKFDGTADYRVWDVATTRQRCRIPSRQEGSGLAFSPDGKLLAVPDGPDAEHLNEPIRIGLWDTSVAKEVRRLAAPMQRVHRVAFSPDGSQLATGHLGPDVGGGDIDPGVVRLWDATTGKVQHKIGTGNSTTTHVAYLPNGKQLLTAGEAVEVWEAATGKKVRAWPVDPALAAATIAPNGRWLGSVQRGKKPGVLLRSPAGDAILPIPNARIMTFTGDSRLAVIATHAGEIFFWELATGKRLLTWALPETLPTALAIAPDNERLAIGGKDTTILVCDVAALLRTQLKVTAAAPADYPKFWQQLGDDAATAGYQALGVLAAGGADVVPFLRERLTAHIRERRPLQERITTAVKALDDGQFPVRDQAAKTLREIGGPAESALRQATDRADAPEVRRAAAAILSGLKPHAETDGHLTGAALRIQRAVQLLEQLPGQPADDLLAVLAEQLSSLREGQEAQLARDARRNLARAK